MKSTVHFILIILLQITNFSVAKSNNNWLDNVLNQLNSDSKISRVAVLTNIDGKFRFQQEVIFKKILQNYPMILINVSNNNKIAIDVSFRLSKFPRESIIYVILQNISRSDISNELNETLSLIIEKSSVSPRPKCLTILFSDKEFKEIEITQQMLVSAWTLKFLDFSILRIGGIKTEIFFYNPFNFTFYFNYFESTEAIFPDKLSNMNGYSINVAIYNKPPKMKLWKNYKTNKTKVISEDFFYIQTLSRKLNFSMTLDIQDTVNNIPGFSSRMMHKLENNEISMAGTKYFVGSFLFNKTVVIGKISDQDRFVLQLYQTTNFIFPTKFGSRFSRFP